MPTCKDCTSLRRTRDYYFNTWFCDFMSVTRFPISPICNDYTPISKEDLSFYSPHSTEDRKQKGGKEMFRATPSTEPSNAPKKNTPVLSGSIQDQGRKIIANIALWDNTPKTEKHPIYRGKITGIDGSVAYVSLWNWKPKK